MATQKRRKARRPEPKPNFDDHVKSDLQVAEVNDKKIWLENAWGSWLKPASVVAAILAIIIVWYSGVIPEMVIGIPALAGALLFPLYLMFNEIYYRDHFKGTRLVLAYSLLGLLLVVSAYPVVMSLLPRDPIAQGDLVKEGDVVPIPPTESVSDQWMLQIEGKLETREDSYMVDYDLRVGDDTPRKKVSGVLKWTTRDALNLARDSLNEGDDVKSGVHYLRMKLTGEPGIELVKKSGKTLGPLKARLFAPVVSWVYLVAAILPLFLFSVMLEVSLKKHPEGSSVCETAALVLMFGFVFSNVVTPGKWFGAALTGGMAGVLSSVILGRLGPILLRPIGKKLFKY